MGGGGGGDVGRQSLTPLEHIDLLDAIHALVGMGGWRWFYPAVQTLETGVLLIELDPLPGQREVIQ